MVYKEALVDRHVQVLLHEQMPVALTLCWLLCSIAEVQNVAEQSPEGRRGCRDHLGAWRYCQKL